MTPNDYIRHDASGLAELVRTGQTSPAELMRCATALAAQKTRALNFMTHEDFARAIDIAGQWQARGPFQGIPFLLKDADIASTRLPTSLGSRLFEGMSHPGDATLVRRFDAAGLIPFGRTTVPELCMGPTTESVRNGGPTRNAWVPTRSAGGSSGGSAVAVATGVVPLAHGNDAGGSIRIPASCNGIFGLKPTRGRTPMGPYHGEGWAGLNAEGVLSRTVRDTALALDAIAGEEPGAPYAAPPCIGRYIDAVRTAEDLGPLRIAVWKQAWDTDIAISPDCLAAVARTAERLASLGHHVEEQAPPALGFEAYTRAQALVVAASLASAIEARLDRLGRPLQPDDLEPAIAEAHAIGRGVTAIEYGRAVRLFHALGRTMAIHMQQIDVVLTPTLTQPPAPLGWIDMNRGYWDFRERLAQYAAFVSVCNASGQPAASVPASHAPDGSPIGVQLIGQFGREDQLLAVAAQLEHVAPWGRPLDGHDCGSPSRLVGPAE